MQSVKRRAFGDAAISAAAFVLLLLTLFAADERVRQRVSGLVGGTLSTSTVTRVGGDLGSVATVLVDAVKDQSVAHAPLVLFAVAATVLVLFMLRT